MTSLIARLLILFAVLLMPFGMTAAPAAPMQDQSASMPMGHCPAQAPKPKAGFIECAMACSAALPAVDSASEHVLVIACAPTERSAAQILHGLHPDTATPPPKRS